MNRRIAIQLLGAGILTAPSLWSSGSETIDMKQAIFRSDIYLKDTESLTLFRKKFQERLLKMQDFGAQLLRSYLNQDDPLHIMYLLSWSSRSQFEAYMEWARAQSDSAELGALLARPPEHVWLEEMRE